MTMPRPSTRLFPSGWPRPTWRRPKLQRAATAVTVVLTGLLAFMTVTSGPAPREAAAQGALFSVLQQGEHHPDPSDPYDVEAFLDRLMLEQTQDGHVVGATVAVVKDGRLVLAKGYGFADLEPPTPVVADRTLFYIASVGKLFTWTAVMQLVEQGTLDLHADISTYLDFAVPSRHAEPITMAHLLTHTAGFEEQLVAVLAEPEARVPLRDFLVRYRPEQVFPPGRYFAYSNYGAALAGHIVERISGEPYEQYVTKHILEPLDMQRSTATQPPPDALMAAMSKGFRHNNGTNTASSFEWAAAAPAGSVRTTAADMATFMLAHLQNGRAGDGRILRESTARDMHTTHFAHDPRLPGMAYGFVTSNENGQDVLWHDGESAQFASYVALLPRQQFGFFIAYNTPGSDPRTMFSAFLDHFYPAPAALVSRLPAIPRAQTSQRAGTYIPVRANFTMSQKLVTWLSLMRVDEEADGTLRIGDQGYVETEPALFLQVGGERLVSFRENDKGDVTHLFWGPLAYVKVPWYQSPVVQVLALAVCLAAFVPGMVGWPINALLRRGRNPSATRAGGLARLARWLAGVLGALSLLLVATWVVLMLRFAETYVYPSQAVALLTWVALLMVPLTLGVVVLGMLCLKRASWGLGWRLHYAIVMLAAVGLVGWLGFWNLLGRSG
jgi:CubicO group peptidase (beta-lactamase class C family)